MCIDPVTCKPGSVYFSWMNFNYTLATSRLPQVDGGLVQAIWALWT